ncbi:MAG: outer membrane protein assembly factor BamA [Elusimicrobia bacterium]|nr:outer membrane protein assembly factor BamA [Elusimicrobiota bacterium]
MSSPAAQGGPAAAEGSAVRPILAQIRVFGIKMEDEDWVRTHLKAKEMEPYPDELQTEDMTTLLASNRFTQVKMRRIELSSAAFRLDIDLSPGVPKQASAPLTEEEILLPPWVIGDFAVKGNQRVKFNIVRAQVKARKDEIYERSDLDRDVQAVLALGQFERVAADISPMPGKPVPAHLLGVAASSVCVRLTLLVEEKMLVKRIRYEGNKGLSKGKLSDEVSLKAKDPFDRAKLNEDTGKILDLYHKKGYLQATVRSSHTVDAAARQVEAVFLIQEGPKSRIEAVRVSGAAAFKAKKVIRQMENRRKKVYDEKKLPEDFKKIETLYKNKGYLDFEVLSSSVSFSEDGSKIFIDLALKEGPQYRCGDTTFSGHRVYKSSELAKAIDYRKGKLFSQERFDFTIRNLQELYAEKGRLRTRVSPAKTFNEGTKLMDVRFDIEESNVVYVDHVDVEGNKATKTYVFKRELVIKEGMPFSVSKVRKSQEKILNLGFIDDVQLDIQNPIDPDRADLTFDVVEGKPGMLTAGAGFSSLDGLIGTLSLQHLNLFGRAQRAAVQWSFGSRVQDYTLSWTTLWTRNKPISLGFDIFNTRRISPFENSMTGYINKRLGGGVRVGPRFEDDKYQLNFHYTFQKITVTDVEAQYYGRLSEGTSAQSSLNTEFARDTRDNIWDPTRGTRNGVGVGLTGGPVLRGDIHVIKPYIFNSLHHTLATVGDYPLVLSVSNRGGYVTQFNETKEVPIFERFYVGGQDSLRGYTYSGQVGYPYGGKVYDVFNVELGFPLARERRKTIVKAVAFFDAGGSWDKMSTVRLRIGQEERDVKTDVGFGIRFVTPAFPIRLDWGYGFNHRPGEQNYQINFGIGSLF